MTAKKLYKSIGYSLCPIVTLRRTPQTASIAVPADEKRRLVAAAAYFRAARHRQVGAEGYRKNDECAAAMELEAVLRRHCIREEGSSPDGRA